eukprot:TRINITY_DN65282_c0_g1_i1.p1 TRINITY_DN65282_c0_g1~~TRINITY_DN65282_c0_g1_i1.p1  ORF type:complete len:668 (-),score=193.11 TRINITY_DN65282_c0_g1_i1:65-2068(-)
MALVVRSAVSPLQPRTIEGLHLTANDLLNQTEEHEGARRECHERTQDILRLVLERRGITSGSRVPFVPAAGDVTDENRGAQGGSSAGAGAVVAEAPAAPETDASGAAVRESPHEQRLAFTRKIFGRLKTKGIHGIRTLRVMLHNMDIANTGTLSSHTFTGALTHLGIRLSPTECRKLVDLFGAGADAETLQEQVDYVQFFACAAGRWATSRYEVVQEAYDHLCDKCPGKLLTVDCIERTFDPTALTEELCPGSEDVAISSLEEFLKQWSEGVLSADGVITWVDFLDYYLDVSWCFESHHAFCMFVCKAWGFDMDDWLAKKVFQRYAASDGGDGETLVLEDFFAMLAELDPTISGEEARAWYNAIDEDDSGEVDLREFLASKVLKAKRLFEKFDEHKTNSVDEKTMIRILQDLNPSLSDSEASALYQYADLDGSGDVSFIEFLQNNLLKLLQMFGEFDKNQGGDLNEAEMKQLLRKQDPFLDDYDIQQIYKAIDTDGGGSISFIEFCESQVLRAKTLFDRYDVDRSRALTLFRFRELMLDMDATLTPTQLEAIYQLVCDPNTAKVHLGGFLNPNIVKLKLLFDKYDQDRSSHLDSAEFLLMLKELFRNATEKEIIQLQRQVYPDEEGVSFTMYIQRFKELSRSHDLMQLAKRRQARRKAEAKGLLYRG